MHALLRRPRNRPSLGGGPRTLAAMARCVGLQSGPVDASEISRLYEQACEGDRRAAKRLVEELAPIVLSTIRQCGVAPGAVEDLAQVVWMKLFENCGRIRDGRAIPGWLKTTARNVSMDWHRKRRKDAQPTSYDLPEVPELEPGYDELDEDDERAHRVKRVRDVWPGLESRCRRLLTLKAQNPPLGNEAVARELDMKTGSVGPTYIRCMQKLRQLLEETER